MLATSWAFGFTGHTGPANRARWSCRSTRWPSELGIATGADHRDAPRRQQPPHRLGRRRASPRLDGRLGLGGRLEVEAHLDHAVGEAGGGLEARLGEHADHRRLSGSTDAVNPRQAHLPRPRREVLEQHGGQPATVVGVVDEERHLGLGPVPPAVVAGDPDELVAAQRDEGEAVDVVDVGEALEVALGEPRARAEVAEVDALGRLPLVEGREPRPVVGTDRSHVGGGAVGQHDVGLEGRRVARLGAAPATVPSCAVHAAKLPVASPRPDGRTRGPPVRRALLQIAHAACSRSPCWRRLRHRGRPRSRPGSTSRATGSSRPTTSTSEIDEPIAPDTGLDGDEAPTSDQVVEAALTDVDAFWRAHLRGPLRHAVRADLRAASGPTAPTPSSRRAATRRPTYDEIAENAFYCPGDDLIAWDNVEPHPRAVRRVRRLHPRHRVRPRVRPRHPDARAAPRAPPIVLELQADCFAGAWTRDVEEGNSEYFELSARRPRQGGRRLPRAPRRRRHRRRRPGRPRHGLRPHRLLRRRLRAAASSTAPAIPDAARDRRAGDRRGALHRPGRLRARRQPPARRARSRRSLEDLEDFWTVLFEEQGLEWTPGRRRGRRSTRPSTRCSAAARPTRATCS